MRISLRAALQDELNKARVQIEAEMVVGGVDQVDAAVVKTYAQDLRSLLEEAGFTERKAFLRSFIKRIEVNNSQVTVQYNLPIPEDPKSRQETGVLPIDTPGGAQWTEQRTFALAFSLAT